MLEKLATKNVPVLGWAQTALRINPDTLAFWFSRWIRFLLIYFLIKSSLHYKGKQN